MKAQLFYLLLLATLTAAAKAPIDSVKQQLTKAEIFSMKKGPKYRPQRAFQIYHDLATKGNPEAMHGLGMLYANGIGTAVNDKESFKWFEKSAKAGYARAWYNLGLIHQSGISVMQNFVKAFDCFNKGASLGDGMCAYGAGYLLYKGLGCAQSYEKAVAFFRKGTAVEDEASYYMLGLCFRNGYGVPTNPDSAKSYLSKAAFTGDKRATDELTSASPENLNISNVPNLQAPSNLSAPVDLKNGFQTVALHVPATGIDGDYEGYALKFDWSGKHIIGQSALKLRLERKNATLSGAWTEEDQASVALTGTLTDSSIVFNNTMSSRTDHYNPNTPYPVIFKNSKMNIVKSTDTVFLTGTFNLYSPKFKEPEKPEFIMLVRSSHKDSLWAKADISAADSIHFVAYPNPFSKSLQIRYTLKRSTTVSFIVSNVLNGAIVYRASLGELKKGDHTTPISFEGSPGNYAVTLEYGRNIKSALIYKQ